LQKHLRKLINIIVKPYFMLDFSNCKSLYLIYLKLAQRSAVVSDWLLTARRRWW